MATWSIGESNAMMLERGEVFHRGFVAPWTAINYCYGLCATGGSTDGHKFDFIIRTRPDMAYSRGP